MKLNLNIYIQLANIDKNQPVAVNLEKKNTINRFY